MGSAGGAPGRTGDTSQTRADRNLLELLNELRVALPGVQVLFAFLLIVPFNANFAETTGFERAVYVVTLLTTALATALLMAPTAHHRIQFRRQDKEFVVRAGNGFALAGLVSMAASICGALLLVTSFVFDSTIAVSATAGTAVVFGLLWFAVPIGRRVIGRAPLE